MAKFKKEKFEDNWLLNGSEYLLKRWLITLNLYPIYIRKRKVKKLVFYKYYVCLVIEMDCLHIRHRYILRNAKHSYSSLGGTNAEHHYFCDIYTLTFL